MSKKIADASTALGLLATIVLAPVSGGASLMLGAPALLFARFIRAEKDKEEENRRKEKSMRSLVPYRQLPINLGSNEFSNNDFFPMMQRSPSSREVLAALDCKGLLAQMERETDADLLSKVVSSHAPAIYQLVANNPSATRIRTKASVSPRLFGGMKITFESEIS